MRADDVLDPLEKADSCKRASNGDQPSSGTCSGIPEMCRVHSRPSARHNLHHLPGTQPSPADQKIA